MRCPNCDSKIKNNLPVCSNCGTKVADINNASYEKALQVLQTGTLVQKEKIFYTYNTPKELSRKRLLWLTICLGIMGAQDFYVGKKKFGISKIASLVLGNIILILNYMGYAMSFYSIGGLLIAYPLLTWIYDIVRVCFKRYPFPVIMDN